MKQTKLTAKDLKVKAQDLIMHQISGIGYGSAYEEFCKEVGNSEKADAILKQQMDRVARLFGFNEAWFS